ncbi:MAG: hypothetical protein U0R17_04445 [Acidimicrobiia bacterium]
MQPQNFQLPANVLIKHPSLIGVIPPLLRLPSNPNVPLSIDGFFDDLNKFVTNFNYKGYYHNPEHFQDVERRIETDLYTIEDEFGYKFSPEERLIAKAFARGHDAVHNGKRPKDEHYFLTVNKICELYGIDTASLTWRRKIKEAINFGINEDIELTGEQRAKITFFDRPIALSEEEMTAIVVDALAYRNGFSFEDRCTLAGMIQATEFKRSMKDGQPWFKWPRTQLEVIGKLADMGNFCDGIHNWLDTSTKINMEVPWFNGTSALDFIKEELHFIDNLLAPVLDKTKMRVLHPNGEIGEPFIPTNYLEAVKEKRDFVAKLHDEIEGLIKAGLHNLGERMSKDLKELLRIIRPALAKTDRSLEDETHPVTIATDQQIETITKPSALTR